MQKQQIKTIAKTTKRNGIIMSMNSSVSPDTQTSRAHATENTEPLPLQNLPRMIIVAAAISMPTVNGDFGSDGRFSYSVVSVETDKLNVNSQRLVSEEELFLLPVCNSGKCLP